MDITYDSAKDAVNIEKHGVSLSAAGALDWDGALVWVDDRRDYGEVRHCALGVAGERVYFVAFADRGDERRIISMRKANNREKMLYAEISDN